MRMWFIGLVFIVMFSCAVSAIDTLDVYYLNVGHGDAILLNYADWECLIDTGYGNEWPQDDPDWDLLADLIDGPLDVFVLSHPDQDHYSAFDLIGCAFPIQNILHTATPEALSRVDELLAELECNCPEVYPSKPKTLALSAHSDTSQVRLLPELRVLHPTIEFYVDEDDKNENSLVLLISLGEVSFLFPGDIELRGETVLQTTEKIGGTLILKVSHHGSASSTSLGFLDWADPELAIISGSSEDLDHNTVSNLGAYGIPYLTTYGNGTICVSTDGSAVWVTTNTVAYATPRE